MCWECVGYNELAQRDGIGHDILRCSRISGASLLCVRTILGTTAISSLGPAEH